MIESSDSKHFSIGLPVAAQDQSLSALFQHVANALAQDDPISMDDVIAVDFATELDNDAIYRGYFTIVYSLGDGTEPSDNPISPTQTR